ncbi:hypothetical protein DXG01_014756 [Tephrocybe rancida]|nr:hypothetical protein DXG01_014756 [Tephrocybe rancida]
MRLGDMAYKYNGVHCFGFIVNLQPDHTGRTGTAMWGATPAFEQMKIDEKDVISRQIANWEALIRRAEMKLNGDSNEEAEKDLWIVNIAPSKPERDHSRKVFVAWLKSDIGKYQSNPLLTWGAPQKVPQDDYALVALAPQAVLDRVAIDCSSA